VKRALSLLAALILTVPTLGLAKPRRKPPKGKGKPPAAEIRGAVREDAAKKPIAGAVSDAEKRKPVPRERDPRLEGPGKEGGAAGGGNPMLQRGQRLEFDGRLVQGQTARSGAVYLFERARSELRSMVRERQSYREEIVRTVFPTAEGPQPAHVVEGGKR
jgi:hypothetical protein